eukprot:4942715-Amphidinium_carterae.1
MGHRLDMLGSQMGWLHCVPSEVNLVWSSVKVVKDCDSTCHCRLDLVPAYLNSSAPEPGTRYDLLVSAFDHAIIVQLVQEISGGHSQRGFGQAEANQKTLADRKGDCVLWSFATKEACNTGS